MWFLWLVHSCFTVISVSPDCPTRDRLKTQICARLKCLYFCDDVCWWRPTELQNAWVKRILKWNVESISLMSSSSSSSSETSVKSPNMLCRQFVRFTTTKCVSGECVKWSARTATSQWYNASGWKLKNFFLCVFKVPTKRFEIKANCQQEKRHNHKAVHPITVANFKRSSRWDTKTCQVTQRDGDLEKRFMFKQAVYVCVCVCATSCFEFFSTSVRRISPLHLEQHLKSSR